MLRLKFFILKEEGMEDLEEMLKMAFNVRTEGEAFPHEIVFFKGKDGTKGFNFVAHRVIEKGVPQRVSSSPFVVKVGEKWKKEGLFKVLAGYAAFRLPVLSGKNDLEILRLCESCVNLPWGEFPSGAKNKRLLVRWLRAADRCFPRDSASGEIEVYMALKRLGNLLLAQ